MKKVLVFGITENPGGVESVIMNYYRNIDRNEIQFDFLCNTEVVAYEEEIKSLGGVIYRVTARSKDRKKFKSDMNNFFLQHAEEYQAIWVNVCSLANIDYLKYAKKYGIKKRIIHAHNSKNMDNFFRGLLHRWNRMFITKYATDFWSCSDEAAQYFYNRKIINCSKFFLLQNAIDYDKFKFNENIRFDYRQKYNIKNDEIVYATIGRLHFEKNVEFSIKVFYEIKKINKNSKLYIIGDGEDKEKLKQLVDKLGLNDTVCFMGVRNDVPNLMQFADCLLFPSLFEGIPVTLIEAQAARLQIFASENINEKVVVDKETIHFLSINKHENDWASFISSKINSKIDRKQNRRQLFTSKGYDIKENAKKLKERFM